MFFKKGIDKFRKNTAYNSKHFREARNSAQITSIPIKYCITSCEIPMFKNIENYYAEQN